MKYITLLSAALSIFSNAYSCSCAYEASSRGFCTVVDDAQNDPMFCVVQATVVSWYHWGMNVKIIDQIRASSSRDTIVVWGDNGACCRPSLESTFHLGDTIVMCVERTDFAGNILLPSEPDYELATHYMLQGCGAYYMLYKNGKVTGFFDNNEELDTIDYNDFKKRVQHCIHTVEVGAAPDHTPVNVYPNPATNWISISSPTNMSCIQVYNSVGQCVLTKNVTGTYVNINLTYFVAGLYTVTVYDADRKVISHHKVMRQ